MKYLIFLIVILNLNFQQSFAQNNQDISEHYLERDTVEVLDLIKNGRKLRRSNPDSSSYILQLAIQKAELIKFGKGQMLALQSLGVTYGMQHNYAEAISSFTEVIGLGAIYDFPVIEADAYNGLGIVYKRIGDYSTSLRYYHESLDIYKLNKFMDGMASTYANLGVLYDMMGETEESYNYYMSAFLIQDSLSNSNDMHSLQTNIAIYHLRKKEYSKALKLFKENISYYDSLNMGYNLLVSYNNVSNIYKLTKDFNASIDYATLAINLINSSGNELDAASAYLNRASAYNQKGQYKRAIQDAVKNVELSKKLGFSNQFESYVLLASIYENMGRYKKALEAQRMVGQYKDSLFEENKVSQYKAEEIKQKVSQKNNKITSQNHDIKELNEYLEREKEWKIVLVVFVVLLLILIVLLYQKYSYRNKTNALLTNNNKLISAQKKEIELINDELENRMLRAQINPHFVFNALNSIQHFITTNDKKSTLKYLTKFSSLLRQILENSISAKVTLADELKFLGIYVDLEALRFDNSFDYHLIVDESIDLGQFEVPILFIQPFVENAILHGLTPKTGRKNLIIRIYPEKEFIVFEIEDNGIGQAKAAELKAKKNIYQKSRGLSVTKQRIKMLQKTNNQHVVSFIDIKSDNGESHGTKVVIKIPKED